ncbi:MAG: restriction endonuclease subunit S [Burkholderiaceae bacterium]|nr:restriction endonuclease subunit S [Burkholderiaceae bacterium]
MKVVPLREAVAVNPKLDRSGLTDDLQVSFVPMAAVGAADGCMDVSTLRTYVEVKKGYTHFRNGDVLFAKVTPCMENGKMAVARNLQNGVGFGSTEFHVLRPGDSVDAQYLYHFVSSQTFRKEAARHMTGAVGLRRVPTAFLESAEIPLPPLARQREIVAEIEKQFSRLDEAVANLQRVKANLKRYKASVLKAAVEGRLVETEASLARREGRTYEIGEQLLQRILEERRAKWAGRGKWKEPESPTADAALPDGWTWASVDQLADVGTGATPKRDKAAYWNDGDVPWVTSSVVNGGYVDQASEVVTKLALAETNLTLYPIGTLLIAMYGEGKTRGKCTELRIPASTNQALAALQVDLSIRGYLRHFLEFNYEEMRKFASGGVQPNLNLSLVRAVCVPLPPLSEQCRIVAEVDRHLSIIREVESEIALNLKRTTVLRQKILHSSFSSVKAE